MRYPQLLVYEPDGRLARLLEGTAGTHRWALRQPRRAETCLRLLRQGGPAVLVVRLSNDLEGAFGLVDRVSRLHPDAAVVVVGDAEERALADLAWDLGARYVLFPPQPRERLVDVVAALMGHVDG